MREPDPVCMPDTGEPPAERLARARALAGTRGAAYMLEADGRLVLERATESMDEVLVRAPLRRA